MQCHASRRSREQACPREEFWDVISTLTQDLTKAQNQLARLMKLAKHDGARLFGGDYGRPALQSIRNCMPYAGYQVPKCHRSPRPGHFGCGKEYPHYEDPSPERRRPPRRPVTACGANSIRHSQNRRAPSFRCGRSPQRPSWSFEQPQDRVQNFSDDLFRAPEAPYSCERQEKCGRRTPRASNYVQICINPDSPAAPRRRSERAPNPCRGGSSPTRLQGGRGRDCIATQFASLLEDVTCQLRERRLAAAAAADRRIQGGD